MKISTKSTSLVLVGILFICTFLTLALAEPQLSGQEQITRLKEHHFQKSSDWGILKAGADTISFPWSRLQILPMRTALSGSISTSKEEILMNSSYPRANVQDLSAINSIKQRDLLYNDSQNGSHQGLVNSQDISVSGKGNDKSADEVANPKWQEDDIGGRELIHIGNYLSIDVHGISVSAMNTVEGGNAVATSNIIIEPVQVIDCPSEIKVKLI